jgi:hypothetical protein
MRVALMALLVIPLVVGCVEDEDKSGVDTASEANAEASGADADGSADADAGPGPVDTDGDGHTDDLDCDRDDPAIFPGADEIPYDGVLQTGSVLD